MTTSLDDSEKISVLFVCMGNICRSPTAEGVFRYQVEQRGLSARFDIDSAGTHAYHVGESPDRRAIAAAERRGIEMAGISARRVADDDFERFDYIIAMDEENLRRLREKSPSHHTSKIRLMLDYGPSDETEVPDPYYGAASGFERVLDLIEQASEDLLDQLGSS